MSVTIIVKGNCPECEKRVAAWLTDHMDALDAECNHDIDDMAEKQRHRIDVIRRIVE